MAFTSQPGSIEPGLFHPGALDSGTVAVSGADTGSAAESHSLSVSLTKTDTGSGTEANSIAATTSSADTGSGVEGQSIVVQVSSSDTGSAVDAGSVSVSVSSTDTGSGTEGTPFVAFSATETGSGAEDSSTSATLSSADTASGVDAEDVDDQSSTTPDGDDAAAGSEDHSIAATLSATDTGSGTESHSIVVTFSSADTGSSTEAVSTALSSSDTGSGTEGTEDIVRGAADSDTATATESQSIAVTLSSADTASGVDSHVPFPAGPVEIGDYEVSLVMGPATIYVADFDSPEPLDAEIATVPSDDYWMDIGTTLDGVVLNVAHEFESPEVMQEPLRTASRLKRRHLTVDLAMAEPTLTNMLYALNSGSLESGAGYSSYSPPFLDRATPLTYRAVMIDGWAPGFSETTGQHRRRRVILRKCLSVDDANLGYTKDELTACNVKWAVHRVNGETTPFKIIDEE
jgi:hypothetical protein